MRARGFTLIELLVVLGIVALMLSLAVPRYFPRLDSARETMLAQNLQQVRETIDHFYGDTGRYPETLQVLVDKHYLKALPLDPITDSDSSWVLVAPPDAGQSGVYDIKSGAPGADRAGRPYAQW